MSEERRWKLLYVSEEILLHSLLGSGPESMVPRCRIDGLPEGWKIERVVHDSYNARFGVFISHPSFEPIGPACAVPLLEGVTCTTIEPAPESCRERPALF